jgi:hypothetical protein
MTDAPQHLRRLTSGGALLSLLALAAGLAWAPPPSAHSGAELFGTAPEVAGLLPRAGTERVLAIGDIHGDLEAFMAILQGTGLLDEEGHWAGGDATLVQTGDFMDRGPDVRGVMDLLMRLQEESAAHGGRVEVLLANHEGMNLVDFWRDNSPADYEAFTDESSEERQAAAYDEYVKIARQRAKDLDEREPDFSGESRRIWLKEHPPGFVERMEALGPEGKYGKWLRTLPAAIRIDDTIFIHAGLNPSLAESPLEEINERIWQELRDFDAYKKAMVEAGLIVPFATLQDMVDAADSELQRLEASRQRGRRLSRSDAELARSLEALLTINNWYVIHPEGPLWFRGYAKWPDVGGDALIDEVLGKLDAKHIVVGHTPQEGAIVARFGGKIFLIDTGMLSSHYEGRASALEIQDGKFTALYGDEKVLLLDTTAGSSGGGTSVQRLARAASPSWTVVVADAPATRASFSTALPPATPSRAAETGERRWYGPEGEDVPLRTDDQILDFLASAEVVDSGNVGQGIAQARWVILDRDGVRMRAIFHDIDEELIRIRVGGTFYVRFTDSWKAQCAAYDLSRLMGLDAVPPTVQRRISGETGSLQAWVENAMTDQKRRERRLRPPDYLRYIKESRIMQVWDNLVYNIDRHAGNILFDSHWNMWLIDHTRAFELKAELLDEDEIVMIERSFWERLQEVSDDAIRDVLAPYIAGSSVSALLERRQKIVDRLQQLIDERGEEAVVFDLETHYRVDDADSPAATTGPAGLAGRGPQSLRVAA